MLPLRSCPPLSPGSCIAVVAPAGPFSQPGFDLGVARLRERYTVRVRDDIGSRAGFFAGDDGRRLAELQAAVDDDQVRAIIAARGGYGVTRILDGLDFSALRRRPKLLVGFSDITALHAQWARSDVRSIHGPMVATLGEAPPEHMTRLVKLLEGAVPEPVTGLECVMPGRAEGVVVGGNLTLLTALLGTPYMPPLAGAVLLLEDIGERPYRIDRMLTTWRLAGVLSQLAAVVLGAFTECEPGTDGVTVHEVLREHFGALRVPVVSGLPAGHIDDNRPLPLGASVVVDGNHGTLTFMEGACETA